MSRATYDQATNVQLHRLLNLWQRGTLSKVEIERKFFKDVTSQGKGITTAWRERCAVETEGKSAMRVRLESLQKIAVDELMLAAKKFEDHGHHLLAIRFRAKAQELA